MRYLLITALAIMAVAQGHARETAQPTVREHCLMQFEQWSHLDPQEEGYWDLRPILKGTLKLCMDQGWLTKGDIAEAYYGT